MFNLIKLVICLSHTLWERIVESRLRKMVDISEGQYGFQPGKSTIQPLFCLRMLQEKHREFGKELHVVFVDMEKAYERVPWELIWYSLKRKGVPEAYITHNPGHVLWVQDKRHDQCEKYQRDID